MAKGKRKSKRRRRKGSSGRRKGGLMTGMRSGFKGIADSVTGKEESDKYKWWGRIITVLLLAAAIGLLANNL
ncbi:MAG: hypothetical protein MJE77_41915 [Proteobacteria bacterium]|nr:hypothetical protein [Pseudomonadota bacterium]